MSPDLQFVALENGTLLLGAGMALAFAKAGVLRASIGRPTVPKKSAPTAAETSTGAPADSAPGVSVDATTPLPVRRGAA